MVSSAEELARFGLGVFSLRLPARLGARPSPDSAAHHRRNAHASSVLGWRIAKDSLGRRYVHHGGASTGGRAFILVYPDQGVAVAILSNTEANFGEAEALAFARLALDQGGH